MSNTKTKTRRYLVVPIITVEAMRHDDEVIIEAQSEAEAERIAKERFRGKSWMKSEALQSATDLMEGSTSLGRLRFYIEDERDIG